MIQKTLLGIALVLAVVGIGLHFAVSTPYSASYGSTGEPTETYTNAQWLAGGISVGPTGTFNQNTQFGTCNLLGTNNSIAATSTANYDCAVPGIKSGDIVFEDPSSSLGAGVIGNIFPIGAHASTTNGYITFTLMNLSGAASTSLDSAVASGTEYYSLR